MGIKTIASSLANQYFKDENITLNGERKLCCSGNQITAITIVAIIILSLICLPLIIKFYKFIYKSLGGTTINNNSQSSETIYQAI